MSFRYVNPGYAELQTGQYNYRNLTSYDSNNSKTGVSIYKNTTYSYGGVLCEISNLINEIYARFDIFYNTTSREVYFRIGPNLTISNYIKFQKSQRGNSNISVICYLNGKQLDIRYILSEEKFSVWLHIRLKDETDGIFEYIMNGGSKYSFSHSYTTFQYNSTAEKNIAMLDNYQGSDDIFFSNIIISDEYISPKEEVIILPTSTISTDMTDNQDGTFTADETNQQLLMTVDASTLISQYGRSSKVTSIAAGGIPAYKTAEGLSNLIGIDKISGNISEHNSVALSSISTLGAFDCWKTNLTLGELNGKQIGLKAAT